MDNNFISLLGATFKLPARQPPPPEHWSVSPSDGRPLGGRATAGVCAPAEPVNQIGEQRICSPGLARACGGAAGTRAIGAALLARDTAPPSRQCAGARRARPPPRAGAPVCGAARACVCVCVHTVAIIGRRRALPKTTPGRRQDSHAARADKLVHNATSCLYNKWLRPMISAGAHLLRADNGAALARWRPCRGQPVRKGLLPTTGPSRTSLCNSKTQRAR